MYVQSNTIWNTNNWKVFGGKKTREPKHDREEPFSINTIYIAENFDKKYMVPKQTNYLFCPSIVITIDIVAAGTFEP